MALARLFAAVGVANEGQEMLFGLALDVVGVDAVDDDPRDVLVARVQALGLLAHLVHQVVAEFALNEEENDDSRLRFWQGKCSEQLS